MRVTEANLLHPTEHFQGGCWMLSDFKSKIIRIVTAVTFFRNVTASGIMQPFRSVCSHHGHYQVQFD